jgi:hypothetical protein
LFIPTYQHVQNIWEVFLSVSAEHYGFPLSVLALESWSKREEGGRRKKIEGKWYKTKRERRVEL